MKDFSKYFTSKNVYNAILHIVLLVLAFEVVLLAKQNREMKNGLSVQRPEVIAVGDSFSVDDLMPLSEDFQLEANARRLFFIFTTTRPYCEKNVENWKRIVELTEQGNEMIAGISLDAPDSTRQYASEHDLNYPIGYPNDITGFKETNKLNGVPITILVGESGVAEKVWLGVLTEENIEEVVAAVTQYKPMIQSMNGGQ